MSVKNFHIVSARDLPDLWFQAVNDIFEKGRRFIIDKGSYAGQTRLEYDRFFGYVKDPSYGSGTSEILPHIPASVGIPDPVDFNHLYGGEGYDRSYIEYLMTSRKEPGESYTYGERLTKAPIDKLISSFGGKTGILDERILQEPDGKIIFEEDGKKFYNQIEWAIDTYKKFGHRNNQMTLQIAEPSDMGLKDPPCLRHIDTRIQDDELSFHVYFRSWDLWGGLPENLAAIQFLKEYMAGEIGVKDGDMIVDSKGLHLYGYAEKLAKLRCLKSE